MARNLITGIDIGTHATRVVVAERLKGKMFPRIIGTGISESRGLRRGYIINHGDVQKTVRQAIRAAEKSSGAKIKGSLVSLGGISLESHAAHGHAIVSRADSEVARIDIDNAIAASRENVSGMANKKVLETIPVTFKLDGKEVWGYPEGMKGTKLEVKTLFVTCLERHLEDIVNAVEEAGVDVEHVVPSPIAASLVALSKKQRTVGAVLANIGAETVSIVVYEDDIPISLHVFPIGSTDITNDIALGFKIPLEEAEQLKVGRDTGAFPRKRLEEIIEARLSDVFELIEAHLKKIGRNGLLPAGIVLTGGGAGISTIEDLAKVTLGLPSAAPASHATPFAGKNNNDRFQDSSWFVAYGLCIFGTTQEFGSPQAPRSRGVRERAVSWLKQLLP